MANEVHLIGTASLRNLAGARVTQAIAGDTITYDTARDTLWSTGVDRSTRPSGGPSPARRVTIGFAPRVSVDPTPAETAPEASPTPR